MIDYSTLAKTASALDARADHDPNFTIESMCAEYGVEAEALTQVAFQRSIRILANRLGIDAMKLTEAQAAEHKEEIARYSAIYMDAFFVAARVFDNSPRVEVQPVRMEWGVDGGRRQS